jgi:DNA-binding transcriptional ArsR family regulator
MPQRKPDVGRIFDALGDPTRRAIVERLGQGPASLSRLAEPLAITLAAVLQQVQILEECGLVVTEKVGRVRTCRLEPAAISAAADWLSERRSHWERSLDRLGEILTE